MTPEDVAGCLEVFDSNVPDFFSDSERDEFRSFLENLPGPYYVLGGDEGLAACGGYAVTAATGVADLCWGMVRRDLHGRGIGRVMTRLRVARAAQDNTTRQVALNTSQHTVGFYERMGFRLVEVTTDGYGAGLDRCDMVMDAPAR